jgi:hypothetical protein
MDRRHFILLLNLFSLVPQLALAAEKKEKGGEGGKTKEPTGTYIAVGLITASILKSNGRRAILAVETGIDAPDPALHAKADKLIPRLQAAYVQSVQTYAMSLSLTSVPDADFISRELQKQTDLVMGARGVRLLLGSIILN